ncbi:hypothetical protein GCM10011611_18700 [Aliidongia dinghuensis]|uniref:EamA domain-containing protein n=1 Tax=Aliidongia dinghuensis TaxID=1867774 RepID=A0A8J2YRX5_9PROT|nr:DMT family transporter [Aliidongia dinghuensis]GGF13250.1 hypothetical protein GCM10011611_18700 [Aliidongia dinghuensis]
MPHRTAGLFWGAVGVFAFSFSFPMTRLAVMEIDPTLVGLGRAVVAGLLAAVFLAVRRAPIPARALWPRLALVATGVVVGFPLFSSLALRLISSAHGAVITGLLPIATAIMAVLRAGERPSGGFWAAAALGLTAVVGFAIVQGAGRIEAGDGLVFLAVALGALGYAEGGALSRLMGGPQVICWALVLSLPVLLPVMAWRIAAVGWPQAGAASWAGFAYVALISMFLGFFAWYRGLALGGVAQVGQIQLAQPVLTLIWSALLLGEAVSGATLLAAGLVLSSVVLTQMSRVRR